MSVLGKLRNLKTLMETEIPPERCWVEHSFIPKGGKLVIGSWAKSGKSWTGLELIKNLLFGGTAFGHPRLTITGEPKILLCEQEIGEYPLQDRIQNKVFQDADWRKLADDRLWVVSREPQLRVDTIQGRKAFRELLDKTQPNILILDPATKFLSGDDSSNTDVAAFFAGVDELLNEYNQLDLSVVLLHHCGKPSKEPPKNPDDLLSPYMMRGASKWFDDPDTIMMMHRSRELAPGWVCRSKIVLRHSQDLPPFDLYVNHFRYGAMYVPDKGGPIPIQEGPRVRPRMII